MTKGDTGFLYPFRLVSPIWVEISNRPHWVSLPFSADFPDLGRDFHKKTGRLIIRPPACCSSVTNFIIFTNLMTIILNQCFTPTHIMHSTSVNYRLLRLSKRGIFLAVVIFLILSSFSLSRSRSSSL